MIKNIPRKTIYISVSIVTVIVIITTLVLTNIQDSQHADDTAATEQQYDDSSSNNDGDNEVSYQTIDSPGGVEQSSISNLSQTIQNIPDSEVNSINRMFGYTLDLNGVSNRVDDAVIREGTYSQSLIDTNRLIYQTTFMVDIPSLQQSYYVKDLYSPLPVEQSGLYDYTVQITCPTSSQLIYQPFDCVDRISYEQTGVRK